MTKAEYIRRYGPDAYNHYLQSERDRCKDLRGSEDYRRKHAERSRKCHKERYDNDSKYRESKKTRRRRRYTEDGRIDLIENYELAAQDNFDGWDIHHKLELHPDGSVRFTQRSLIKLDLYYNRPPSELIWLKYTEHRRMHGKARE